MKKSKVMGILEGLLFASGDPIDINELSKVLEIPVDKVLDYLKLLKEEYKKPFHGIDVSIVGNRARLTTKSEISFYIEKFFKPQEKERLSRAALETLAIVMFQQPVTRTDIEAIRGVSSEKALSTLKSKNLVYETGRLDKPGRPILYSVTEDCLEYFGIKNIEEIQSEYKNLLCINR